MTSLSPSDPKTHVSLIGFTIGIILLLATLGIGILTEFTPTFGLQSNIYNTALISGTGIGLGSVLYTTTRLSSTNISVTALRIFIIGHISVVLVFVTAVFTSQVNFEMLFVSLVVLTAIESTLLHTPVLQLTPDSET